MIKKIIFFLSLFLLLNPAYADVFDNPSSIEKIIPQLPEIKTIKCKFKQEKYLQNISKPVISGGNFEFIENKGVFFYTTYPIKSTQDYTNKNYKQINDVIKAILSKKYSAIERIFSFYFEKEGSIWSLGMKPKEGSNTEKHIENIKVIGSDYIRQISIIQKNGNKTTIWFDK
ncbi:outer membrane lipoprotein carrier protein LolA [bacterium]|nr:outer membrane lipoprotein carrier protein LolA [bacterium]